MSLTANHFELFNLPASFDIDKNELANRYRELQRAVHPDKYANASDRERRLALQKTAQINEAFQTLKNALARGQYLLQLQDIDVNDANDTTMDNLFLMEQMELREEMAEISHFEALNDFLNRMEQKMQNLDKTLSQQFANNDFVAAKDSVRKYQFFRKLHEEALVLEERFM